MSMVLESRAVVEYRVQVDWRVEFFCLFYNGLYSGFGKSYAHVTHLYDRGMSGFEPRKLAEQAGTLQTTHP